MCPHGSTTVSVVRAKQMRHVARGDGVASSFVGRDMGIRGGCWTLERALVVDGCALVLSGREGGTPREREDDTPRDWVGVYPVCGRDAAEPISNGLQMFFLA